MSCVEKAGDVVVLKELCSTFSINFDEVDTLISNFRFFKGHISHFIKNLSYVVHHCLVCTGRQSAYLFRCHTCLDVVFKQLNNYRQIPSHKSRHFYVS